MATKKDVGSTVGVDGWNGGFTKPEYLRNINDSFVLIIIFVQIYYIDSSSIPYIMYIYACFIPTRAHDHLSDHSAVSRFKRCGNHS